MSRGNLSERIVIQYPPDFDGELWIDCESIPHPVNWDYRYTFTHAEKGNTWETLVAAAKAIIAQDERIKNSTQRNEDPLGLISDSRMEMDYYINLLEEAKRNS